MCNILLLWCCNWYVLALHFYSTLSLLHFRAGRLTSWLNIILFSQIDLIFLIIFPIIFINLTSYLRDSGFPCNFCHFFLLKWCGSFSYSSFRSLCFFFCINCSSCFIMKCANEFLNAKSFAWVLKNKPVKVLYLLILELFMLQPGVTQKTCIQMARNHVLHPSWLILVKEVIKGNTMILQIFHENILFLHVLINSCNILFECIIIALYNLKFQNWFAMVIQCLFSCGHASFFVHEFSIQLFNCVLK